MKKMILGWFLYGTAVGLCAQAPQGDFKGSIQIGQTTMPIVFHFGQQNGQPTTTMDSPAQGVFGFPVQSSECLSDGELTLKIPQIQFRYVGKVRSDSLIEGTVTQAGQSLPLNLVRTARKAGVSSELERPGTPKPPFPYREEEVSVTTKDGIKLSGSLTLPEGEGPFPAVLLISGSGPQDRNEEAWKYKPFLMIADCLTRQVRRPLCRRHLATRCHGCGMCLGLSSPTERHPTRKDRTGRTQHGRHHRFPYNRATSARRGFRTFIGRSRHSGKRSDDAPM